MHLTYWYFEDSWLHYYVKHDQFTKLYGIHLLHIVTVFLYLLVAFSSPGFVQIKHYSNERNSPKYCAICKIIRPRRSKHCYECGKCIIKYDHHCIFTANCVGANNHCLFVVYLLIQVLFCCWSWPLSIDSVIFGFGNVEQIGCIQLFYRFICCVAISFASIGLMLLFAFHCYLIVTNQTTYVYLKKYGFCGKRKEDGAAMYDAKHFDPDIASHDNSVLSNIVLFFTEPVPNDWMIGTIHEDITPKSALSISDKISQINYIDSGVGCVPLPSFKTE